MVLFAALAALYAIVFFCCRLPSLGVDRQTGEPVRRTIIWLQTLLPDQIVANWFGDGAQVGLADRLPIAGTAILLWLLAWAPGRLVLGVLGVDRRLSNLERGVLAAGVGANLFSLYLLALGLAGHLSRPWLLAIRN